MIAGSQLTWLTGNDVAVLRGCGTAGDPASSPAARRIAWPMARCAFSRCAAWNDDQANQRSPPGRDADRGAGPNAPAAIDCGLLGGSAGRLILRLPVPASRFLGRSPSSAQPVHRSLGAADR